MRTLILGLCSALALLLIAAGIYLVVRAQRAEVPQDSVDLLDLFDADVEGAPTANASNTAGLQISEDEALQARTVVDSFVAALRQGDEAGVFALTLGYEAAASRIRTAALQEHAVLQRQDLIARHKLSVLALRHRYSAQQIAALPDWQIVTARPSVNADVFALPPEAIQIHDVRLESAQSAAADLYVGTQFHTFALIQTADGWRLDISDVIDPAVLTAQDQQILTTLATRDGSDAAWLGYYSTLAGENVGAELLQLPQ